MKEDEDNNIIYNCSFCGSSSYEVEYLVKSRVSEAVICGECIIMCNVIDDDRIRDDLEFYQTPNSLERQQKLRQANKLPKRWIICATELYKKSPTVTARSPDGDRSETFSLPTPLARWLISYIHKTDIAELKKDVKKEIIKDIKNLLKLY